MNIKCSTNCHLWDVDASVEFSAGSGTEASHDIRGTVTIALLLASVVGLTIPSKNYNAEKIVISD